MKATSRQQRLPLLHTKLSLCRCRDDLGKKFQFQKVEMLKQLVREETKSNLDQNSKK